MYKIKRFSRKIHKEVRFGLTTDRTKGDNWHVLLDKEIYDGAKRVDDKVLGLYNMEWICDYKNLIINITKLNSYISDLNKKDRNKNNLINGLIKNRVKRFENDLKLGYIYKDNPNIEPRVSDKTHLLYDLCLKDSYLVYSKSITESDKFVYIVHKPVIDEYKTILNIDLVNCIGHRFMNREYMRMR